MAITPSDFSKIWSANATTPAYTFSDAEYQQGWDFVGNLPPTRAMWNAIQKRTDEKMKYIFDNFGAPLTASTVAEMTMQNRVYVYTGSETGYTAGHWYYWNGSAWTDGGVYNSNTVQIDPTLTISGAGADAQVTGNLFKGFDIVGNTQSLRFENGSLNSSTGGNAEYLVAYRRRTIGKNIYPFDVIVELTSSAVNTWFDVFTYQSDGTYIGHSGQMTTSYRIPANTFFRMVLQSGTISDTTTILNSFKCTFVIDELIKSFTQLGGTLPSVLFEKGGINGNTGEKNSYRINSRIRTKDFLRFSVPVRIRAIDGDAPTVYYYTYSDDGTFVATYPYGTDVVIPADVNIMLMMTKNNEADILASVAETLSCFEYGVKVDTESNAIYVSPTGNDNNAGTSASSPRLSIQKAVDDGFKTIYLAPGSYTTQQVVLNGKSGIKFICNSTQTEVSLFESQARQAKAKLDNSVDMTNFSAYNSIFRSALTVDSAHSFYKVFISKELDPVYSSSTYYGQAPTYNAILWEITDDIRTCRELVPKLTVAEVEATEGTFTYDGSYVYVNPYDGTMTGKTYKRLYYDAPTEKGFTITNCTNISFENVEFSFFPLNNMSATNCSNIYFEDCTFAFSPYGGCCSLYQTNAVLRSCIGGHAGSDTYGIGGSGNVSLYDCSAYCNKDDGVSHHTNCSGVVDGGEWAYNLSGGITPAFGANVDVRNVVCHDNAYGLHYLGTNTLKTNERMIAMNNLMYDNTTKDFACEYYNVISKGCMYRTKSFSNGTVAEYGNQVIQ